MSRFAEMLEAARRRRGLSKERAANELHTSSTTYRQWLRGQRPEWERVPVIVDFIDEDEGEVLKALARHGAMGPYDGGSPDGDKGLFLNSEGSVVSFPHLRKAS